MHIPSARIYGEMRAESASVWIVPANSGKEIAVLIKVTTPSIKALLEGCDLCFLFGKKDSYVVLGARVSDIPESPNVLLGVPRYEEEHAALKRALSERKFPLFLFNEMDVCLAWSNATVELEEANAAEKFLGDLSEAYVGDSTEEIQRVLDCFDESVDASDRGGAGLLELHELPIQIEKWVAVNNHFLGQKGHYGVNIADRDEGEMLERAIWASLESVFPTTLHKGPSVQKGSKRREFTDVFSSYEHGSFLIETKDLSVFSTSYRETREERLASVQKQVRKAIKQLTGASKAFKRGDKLFNRDGEEIIVDRAKPPHCIVLITELMHFGDWSEIVTLLAQAMQDTGAFFHLLDFREFVTIVKGSSGNPMLIDANLMNRCEIFCKNPDVHLRSRIPPQK